MKRKFYKSCVAVLLSMVMIFGGGQIGAVADAGIVPFGPVQPTVPTISVNVVTPSSQMLVGDTMQLSCITNPAGLSVTWTSSNTSVATVNSSGLVTAFQKGVVTIMGECYDSNAKNMLMIWLS